MSAPATILATNRRFFNGVSKLFWCVYPFLNSDYANLAKAILKNVANRKSPRVLDLGCGVGTLLIEMSKLCSNGQLHGLDMSRVAINLAKIAASKKSAKIQLSVGDWFNRGSYPQGGFDIITCVGNSISHYPIEHHIEQFRLVYEKLNPKGIFIIDTYEHWTQLTSNGGPQLNPRGIVVNDGFAHVVTFLDRFRGRRLEREVEYMKYRLLHGIAAHPDSVQRFRVCQYAVDVKMLAGLLKSVGFKNVSRLHVPGESTGVVHLRAIH